MEPRHFQIFLKASSSLPSILIHGNKTISPSSYYNILGVSFESSFEDIRRAYRKQALKWHPDRWAANPSRLGEAKLKFRQIQEPYSVLSDHSQRTLYDAGLYDPNDEEDDGFSVFVQEMASLMSKVKQEEKLYSIEELQGMLMEMVQDFESPAWCGGLQESLNPEEEDYGRQQKRTRCDDGGAGSNLICTN